MAAPRSRHSPADTCPSAPLRRRLASLEQSVLARHGAALRRRRTWPCVRPVTPSWVASLTVPELRYTPGVACWVMAVAPSPQALPIERADRFAVVDVETNGLSNRRHRRSDRCRHGRHRRRRHRPLVQLVRPPRAGRATHIHGLTAAGYAAPPSPRSFEPLACLDGAVFTARNAALDWASSPGPCVGPATARPTPPPHHAPSRASPPTHSHRLVDVHRHGIAITKATTAGRRRGPPPCFPCLADGGLATAADLAPSLGGRAAARWPTWTSPSWWRRAPRVAGQQSAAAARPRSRHPTGSTTSPPARPGAAPPSHRSLATASRTRNRPSGIGVDSCTG